MSEQRIYLRALEPSDYKVSINWRKDDSIWDMLGGTKYYVSEAYEKKWVEDTIFQSKDLYNTPFAAIISREPKENSKSILKEVFLD